MTMLKSSRRVVLIILLIIMTAVPIFGIPPTVVSGASTNLQLKVTHTIQIRDGGLVVLVTDLDLYNNGTASLSDLLIGFSKSFDRNLDKVIAHDLQGTELEIVSEGVEGEVSWFTLSFADVLKPDQTQTLSIYFVFSGLITYDGSDSDHYSVTFPECPVLPFDAERCYVEIILPPGSAPQQSSLNELLTETKTPFQAYTNTVGFITFSGDLRILECHSLRCDVLINPWGSLQFSSSYRIQNVGKVTLSDLTLRLPLSAEEIRVYDGGGLLDNTVTPIDAAQEVQIHLRYPLRGTDSTETYHDSVAFTVSYRLDSHPYLTSEGNHHLLTILLPEPLNFTIRHLMVSVLLPEGAQYQQSSHSGDVETTWWTQSISHVFTNVIPLRLPSLIIDYDYFILWSVLRPILWIGGVIAVVGASVLYRRRRRPSVPTMPEEDIKLIKSFTEVYDERMILWTDLDALEDDLDQRRIRKRHYNRRTRIIRQRMRSLERTLTNLKKSISQMGPRYADRISRVEEAETEILALRENMGRLRVQHRSGRLSRRAYRELTEDSEKRIERHKRVIEGVIIELRSEI